MSQIYKPLTSAGPIPPIIPTSFEAQNNGIAAGAATPAANIIHFNVTSSTDNNTNGLQASAAGSTVLHQLTNRFFGSVSSTGAETGKVIMSFTPPLTAGIYKLLIQVVGYDAANFTGATYQLEGTVNADGLGGLATLGSPIRDMDGDAAFNVTQVTVDTAGGTITVTADGLAGRTIKWTGLTTFVFGGA